MSYSVAISTMLAETLTRFASLNSHQLAGHIANLDFWLAEVNHCIAVLDGHRRRYEAMKAAQVRYATDHSTREYSYLCDGYCPDCAEGDTASPPKRIPHGQFKDAVWTLRDAAYQFLLRCHKAGLIDEAKLCAAADTVGTGVDVADLRR
jgi:hypothetical protein